MSGKDNVYDIIIIGSGPAGLSAGINASRSGLRTLILETEELGGKAAGASLYENYPGFPEGIMAVELVEKMQKQASKFNAEIRYLEEVIDLDLKQDLKKVTTNKTIYETLTLVIATGTQRRKLNVPGEAKFIGRGVSYCRVCDGPFFKGLKVAVVGFTKDAITDAMLLSEMARAVLLITQGEEITVPKELMTKLIEQTNVKIVEGRVVTILGEHAVKAIKIKLDNEQELLEQVNGVFISLGKAPATRFVERAGIKVDERGCVRVDRWQRTNIEGVFAAGDCTCGGMQVVTAVGEGAMASLKALGYIRRMEGGFKIVDNGKIV
ncbi:MAG: FAD-dependent oxidoreductase [Candidatus Bathyarchaeota archaeon]|nr:FAD-dependent oxidoreductase [Candidatus Bathyarchaeota archaeon]MDH5494150.1 FAD-dependent oxidoreductase [Candidatus Bathyarchaeota archaeon]